MNEFNNPWLALSTYEEEDQDKFKGREEDAANMVAMLQQNEYVVCYAASGDGKSSLINAGVCPEIRKLGVFPIKIIFNADDEEELKQIDFDFDKLILDKIHSRLEEYKVKFIEKHNIDEKDFEIGFEKNTMYQDIDTSNSLWWKLRTETIQVSYGEFDYVPVLIFDQFEEVLRAPWKTKFFKWLEELSRDICPDRIITSVGITPDNLPTKKLFKMLFSLRYEYVGELDYWCSQRNYIPQLMRNRYFLKPLSREQAIAIINEQGEEDDPTSERLKQEAENIVERIISSSSNNYSINDEVPAIMLSLACFVYYEEIKNNTESSINDLSTLIYNHYLDQLSILKMPEGDRLVLENALLSPQGTRARIPTSDPRLKKININKYLEGDFNLFSTRLFKKEETGKDNDGTKEFYIEFVHDKLADAIQKNKAKNRIPFETKKKIAYFSILLFLIVISGIISYISIAPKKEYHRTALEVTPNPITLTADDIDSFNTKDYYNATSITLDRQGRCKHTMDCYQNVLTWVDHNTLYVKYAHNAKKISFLYRLPYYVSHFGPNTQKVFLLPEEAEDLSNISFINCENKNTIIYVPYGYGNYCLEHKAFSNVYVKELSAISTISKRLLYHFHLEHSHIGGREGVTVPYWIGNMFWLFLIWNFIRIFRVYKTLQKTEKRRIVILMVVCYEIVCVATMAVYIRWPKLLTVQERGAYFDLFSSIVTILVTYLLIRLENMKQRKSHVVSSKVKRTKGEKQKLALCGIIFNSTELKPYAIALKKGLVQNGMTESDVKLDLNIVGPKGFDTGIAQSIESTSKKIIVVLEEKDLLTNDQNKVFHGFIKKTNRLHPVFVNIENLSLLSIPNRLKSCITLRSSGTLKAFQSIVYNPNTNEQATISSLVNAIKQRRTIAAKKTKWSAAVIYLLSVMILELDMVNDWNRIASDLAILALIVIEIILILYYSARIDFPRLKKWHAKLEIIEKRISRKIKSLFHRRRNDKNASPIDSEKTV